MFWSLLAAQILGAILAGLIGWYGLRADSQDRDGRLNSRGRWIIAVLAGSVVVAITAVMIAAIDRRVEEGALREQLTSVSAALRDANERLTQASEKLTEVERDSKRAQYPLDDAVFTARVSLPSSDP